MIREIFDDFTDFGFHVNQILILINSEFFVPYIKYILDAIIIFRGMLSRKAFHVGFV